MGMSQHASDEDKSAKRARTTPRGRNAIKLATENPFGFDKRIEFEDESHRYKIDGNLVRISATALVDRAYTGGEKFDGPVVARRCLASWRAGRGNDKYIKIVDGKDDDEAVQAVCALWRRDTDLGTLLHKAVELTLNGEEAVEDTEEFQDIKKEITSFKRFQQGTPLQAIRTELSLFYEKDGNAVAAGQADMLLRNTQGKFVLVDLKRSSHNLTASAKPGNATPRFLGVSDTKYHRYSLQNSLYAVMIEQLTTQPVDEMYLLQVVPGIHLLVIECADFRKEATASLSFDRLVGL